VLRFANYIQDHMVLQRAPQRAIVWGFGDSSTITTLTIHDKIYTTMSRLESANAQNETIWSVTLDPVSSEGPFDIHVSQPLANGTLVTITIHDVLFGDVWVCSGQSNMQMTVSMIFNATEEISNAGNFPKIRLFTAALIPSETPVEELLGIVLNWSVASPESVGGSDWNYTSAVCWLYGRMIHQALDGRSIGLIATSWAGTAIEVWMPPQALHDCGNACTFEALFYSAFIYFLRFCFYRSGNVAIESYDVPPGAHSCLFNSMIYPFTRMVVYGSIWYQGKNIYSKDILDFIYIGESNAGDPTYACKFAKMIQYWRYTWNERTKGSTDIQFPFGFVQVNS
jgi:sialate O-acetylesterase